VRAAALAPTSGQFGVADSMFPSSLSACGRRYVPVYGGLVVLAYRDPGGTPPHDDEGGPAGRQDIRWSPKVSS
jgi:hypothetical protein